jgi:cyclic-di-GMP-binding protein
MVLCRGLFCEGSEAMAAESTFDLVSDFDRQELSNAVDQAQREVRTRYDLKDSNVEMTLGEKELTIVSESELHIAAVRDILQSKVLRRNLSLKILKFGVIEEIGGMRVRQVATIQKGIAEDLAKKIQKELKAQFPKVQARIQGDALRIGSKSKDDLQSVIQYFREREDQYPVPLQFTNYR